MSLLWVAALGTIFISVPLLIVAGLVLYIRAGEVRFDDEEMARIERMHRHAHGSMAEQSWE